MNLKHILGTVTILAIVGGTIYAIKKSKDLQKAEEDEITLAEAKAMVKETQFDEAYEEEFGEDDEIETDEITFTSGPIHTYEDTNEVDELTEEEIEILKEGVRLEAEFYSSTEDEYEDIDENTEGPTIEFQEERDDNDIGRFKEEDRTLRYEPSSIDALKQFKRMELAELDYNSEAYQTMLRLYDFPFQPLNDGDEMMMTQIIDYRVQFFGFGSKWCKQVTFADVILHYARLAMFNCDETLRYWVEYFLEFNDLYYQYSSSTLDQAIKTLNQHKYFNEERHTFGLFGLTRQSMDSAIRIANRNIDSSVTYDLEFQEFLKSII